MYIYDTSLNLWNEKYFKQKVVEQIETHILWAVTFPKIVSQWDNVEKYGKDDNTVHALWMLAEATHTHTHTHTHTKR
jgi:hypothetical protein